MSPVNPAEMEIIMKKLVVIIIAIVMIATLALPTSASANTTRGNGDTNRDGEITTADALEVLRHVAGLPSAVNRNARTATAAASGNGTQSSPYNWAGLIAAENITIEDVGRGFTIRSRNGNDWVDIWVAVSGADFGVIQYSSSQTTSFRTQNLKRNESVTLRLFEGTFWLTNEPINVSNVVFNTGNMLKADNSGYGWTYTPAEAISFWVPRNQGIKEIHAFNPLAAEVQVFLPGERAYVGTGGGTIWFNNAQTLGTGATTYARNGCADVTGDGQISTLDALEILKEVAGLPSLLHR